MMLGLVGKGDNLGLYARTVTRAYALYLAIVKGRLRQSSPEYIVRLDIRFESVARALGQLPAHIRHIAEFVEVILPLLLLGQTPVDRTAVDAYRGAGLHAVGAKTHVTELLCQPGRCSSLIRPPGHCVRPTCISPLRNVPAVSTTALAVNSAPRAVRTPHTLFCHHRPCLSKARLRYLATS